VKVFILIGLILSLASACQSEPQKEVSVESAAASSEPPCDDEEALKKKLEADLEKSAAEGNLLAGQAGCTTTEETTPPL
jgi:hypothetical protein